MRGVGICVIKCHEGGGEGVKKCSNLCYVINEWPLTWNFKIWNLKACPSRVEQFWWDWSNNPLIRSTNKNRNFFVWTPEHNRIYFGFSPDCQAWSKAVVVVHIEGRVTVLEDVDKAGPPLGGLGIAQVTVSETCKSN